MNLSGNLGLVRRLIVFSPLPQVALEPQSIFDRR